MSKKNKKRRSGAQPNRRIRISQCMIVKNEEKNILRALDWAKDIAFEQIVVDTGSTDRTVELAERAGAKVYHFEWIDNFAAAKNFAIDKASGDWIAFLDADEYFLPEDARELVTLLHEIENSAERMKYQAITCSWIQLGNDGKAFASLKQERVFRNEPGLRYEGKIHEWLTTTRYNVEDLNLRIMHDGYSEASYKEAGKASRNQRLLLAELEHEPDNPKIMIYLANSLKASMTEAGEKEAEVLFRKALDSGAEIHPLIKKLAYDFLIPYYIRKGTKPDDTRRLCGEAIEAYPEYVDFHYYSGILKNIAKDYEGALDDLYKAKQMMEGTETPLTGFLLGDTAELNEQLALAMKNVRKQSELKPGRRGSLKLSQCMIVKNEEENIERALEWARDIAFEQIVVDTGSTDKTVEIAERLGAKVYHFKWIDDFSAAKNFAIEKASGDWIAFLDADEYFSAEDAQELVNVLEKIDSKPDSKQKWLVISCPWIQISDFNKPFAVLKQARVFRNQPDLRYQNRIHEALTVDLERIFDTAQISIYHTGYTTENYIKTGKAGYYAKLLREDLKRDPDNLLLKGYLADALRISTDEKDIAESMALYKEILDSGGLVDDEHKKIIFVIFIDELSKKPDSYNELIRLCERAFEELPDDIDLQFLRVALLLNYGEYNEGRAALAACEDRLKSDHGMRIADKELPIQVFCQLAIAAKNLDERAALIEYITHAIKKDKYQSRLLSLYIHAFKSYGISDNDIIGLLQVLYDFSSIRDKLFIVRAAKESGATEFAKTVMDMITRKDREWMSEN